MKVTLFTFMMAATLAAGGCQRQTGHGGGATPAAEEEEGWAVTSWGERYEIFAEADPLVVGAVSKSHTHVTILDGFAPLRIGVVDAVLRDERGAEQVFRQATALRDGIYSIEIKPASAGTFDLMFRVESAAGFEQIPSGRVRVGDAASPGGLVEPPGGPPDSSAVASAGGGDGVSFLKEQQWRTSFATAWAEQGSVNQSARGPGRIRPAAGGEALLVAPVDGIVVAPLKAYIGLDVPQGEVVAQLRPRVGSDRSVSQIRGELQLAEARLARLEELLKLEATSEAEVEEARARVQSLTAERQALAGEGPAVAVRAPFSGRIAEVLVIPGQAVTSGAPLARLVRFEPVWLEVALKPEDARSLDGGLAGLILREAGSSRPLTFGAEEVRLVSRAPEVSGTTGSVAALIELKGTQMLRPGTAVDAEVLFPGERAGIVVPADAIVDDGGVPVLYVQNDGESFARLEVRVVATQGDRTLVEGPAAGSRIVTLGGAAIRRAALLQTGPPEGHVH
jgi:RND family efflux transporter MFP subunit